MGLDIVVSMKHFSGDSIRKPVLRTPGSEDLNVSPGFLVARCYELGSNASPVTVGEVCSQTSGPQSWDRDSELGGPGRILNGIEFLSVSGLAWGM